MEDAKIIELYLARSEQAIQETDNKYGRYCYTIAYQILACREDAQESVSDTYLAAWKAIPPKMPAVLATFLGKITRYISLDRWKARTAQKRGSGEVALSLEELTQCIPGGEDPESVCSRKELQQAVNRFLSQLSQVERKVFVCRYWYLDATGEIARRYGFSDAKVRTMLSRIRKKLRIFLAKEGLT